MRNLLPALLLFLAPFGAAATIHLDSLSPTLQTPLVRNAVSKIRETLAMPLPIRPLEAVTLGDNQIAAQDIVLRNPDMRALCFDSTGKNPFRMEVFGVMPARPSDYSIAPECADGSCYRVEIYNYATNSTLLAIVQLSQRKMLRMGQIGQTQPDIPAHLKDLALHIATESPEVAEALGFKPEKDKMLMADTKTALNRTRCERSRHLCVAPTFVKGNKALWVIVDLTDLKVAGLRWTTVGENVPTPTERRAQNANITDCYCKKTNIIERDGWKLNYLLTSSDGMRVSEVDYQGKRVIKSAKLVDWHVSYSGTDGFGYSDAVGCPFFSAAAVLAIEPPKIYDLIENGQKAGFVLSQNFFSEGWPTPCNYNYEQRFEFYTDGRFRVSAASLGRGCGNDGTYRPVTRIAFEGTQNQFSEWNGDGWQPWQKERWQIQNASTKYSAKGEQYKILDPQTGAGFAIEANTGQMNDGGRGDQAYVYVTRNHPELDEGEADMITIGPCCNTDYRQGPEKFIEPQPENIGNGTELVFWYVPQLKNDSRDGQKYCWADAKIVDGVYSTTVYPCFSGAMFVPVK